MQIPKIPKEDQVQILETNVTEFIDAAYGASEVSFELVRRLEAGAAKYGTAWNEVNLTEDLREELLDAMNYVVMLLVRRERVAKPGADDVLLGMVAETIHSAYKIVSELEQCEGPTSKDWVEKRGDTEAQARFQARLNAARRDCK